MCQINFNFPEFYSTLSEKSTFIKFSLSPVASDTIIERSYSLIL